MSGGVSFCWSIRQTHLSLLSKRCSNQVAVTGLHHREICEKCNNPAGGKDVPMSSLTGLPSPEFCYSAERRRRLGEQTAL